MIGKGAKDGTGQITSRTDSLASVEPQRSAAKTSRPGQPRGATRVRAILKTNRPGGNLLDCEVIDKDAVEIGDVVAARGDDLRADYWDFAKNGGETIDGVTFTFVSANERTGVDGVNPDETHKISPNYVEDSSILTLERFPNGTGLTDDANDDRPVVWQDVTPGRQWAVET